MTESKKPPKDIPMKDFYAKKAGKHGSGKFHWWDDTRSSLCGGSPGKPTTNRRLKMPYLHCSRCVALLERRAKALSTPQASPTSEIGLVGHPSSSDVPLGSP